VSDVLRRNSDETIGTDDSSVQDVKNSSSATEPLALPILERHGEASLSLGEGEQPTLTDEGAGSAAAGGGSSTGSSDENIKSQKSCDEDDDGEMPELTLYTS